MQARTRNLLAVALGAALVSPLAMAQDKGQARTPPVDQATRGAITSQAAQETPRPTLPPQASDQAGTVVPEAMPRPSTQSDAQDDANNPMGNDDTESSDTDDAMDDEDAMPTQSQGAAQAAPPSRVARDEVFATLDADGDGSISATEAEADTDFNATFGTLDADGDGTITQAEYQTYARTQVPGAPPEQSQGAAHAAGNASVVQRATFAPLDSDGDGRISATEAQADADFDAGFGDMDADGDGFVTDAEFRAHAGSDEQAP